MLYRYDKALVDKFKKVFDRVVYAPTDKFYERYLLRNNENDKIELPSLSLWRTSTEFKPDSAKHWVRQTNDYRMLPEGLDFRNVYSMEVNLNYQLDIWAANDRDKEDFLSEILYFINVYPDIAFEYQGFNFEFPVLMFQSPDDTTDITNFESTGDLYRYSVPLSIPDARYMYYQDSKVCRFIDLSLYCEEELIDHEIIEGKEDK